ncbi:MAG: archaeosortase/exosortase family protein [Chitinispirillaceae bacterium]|nr:archaeosortase/exosortase family protein [Chitinispirillaceae bacterium]
MGMLNPFEKKRLSIFIIAAVFFIAVFHGTVILLVRFAFSSDAFSYIPLVPMVSLFFLFKDRKAIFEKTEYSFFFGTGITSCGMLLHVISLVWGGSISRENGLTLDTISLLVSLWGIFVLCFGIGSFRKALFPLLFLVFIIPLPKLVERLIVEMFRAGSAEMVAFYFTIIGVPFFREGDTFQLEHLRFCVASQCSGINSGLSLFIVSVIAAKVFLKNTWVRVLFILSVVPIGWSKNGLRIATLTLLGSYVNPDFLSGPLHRQGGRPFFIVALLFLGGSLFLCRVIEKQIWKKISVSDTSMSAEDAKQ